MTGGKTVLGLIEAREGIRIDERKLSARLVGRIGKLDEMLIVFDKLKLEIEGYKRKTRGPLMFLIFTSVFGVVGVVVGLLGVAEGLLAPVNAAVAIGGALGMFVVSYFILDVERRSRWAYRRRSKEVEEVELELDNSLDRIYDEILAELSAYGSVGSKRGPK